MKSIKKRARGQSTAAIKTLSPPSRRESYELSREYGAHVKRLNMVLRENSLSPMFVKHSTFLARIVGQPGPTLVVSYILHWLQPGHFKPEDKPKQKVHVPRGGKTHRDAKHWMFNTYGELSEQLGYPSLTIRNWVHDLQKMNLIETKRAWAQGKQ